MIEYIPLQWIAYWPVVHCSPLYTLASKQFFQVEY